MKIILCIKEDDIYIKGLDLFLLMYETIIDLKNNELFQFVEQSILQGKQNIKLMTEI